MAHISAARIKETSTTTGTITYVLDGAVGNHDAFSERMANNDTCYYIAIDQGGAGWEWGLGTWTTGNNLARTTVKQSTNSDAAVSWAAGTRDILIFWPPIAAEQQVAANFQVIDTNIDPANAIQINGNMLVSQENLDVGLTPVDNISTYIVDQWYVTQNSGVGVYVAKRVTPAGTPPVGMIHALEVKATTADATISSEELVIIRQPIEGNRAAGLGFGATGARSVTIGFWVYATEAGEMAVSITNGAFSRSYVTEVTIAAAVTWEFHTVIIPGDVTGTWDDDTDLGMNVTFCFMSGTSFQGTADTWEGAIDIATDSTFNFFDTNDNLVQIGLVSIIAGSWVLTEETNRHFQRSFGEELLLSQRYWEKSWDHDIAVGAVSAFSGGYDVVIPDTTVLLRFSTDYSTQKRVIPTLLEYDFSGNSGVCFREGANKASSIAVTGEKNFTIQIDDTTLAGEIAWQWTADARL